MAGKPQTSAGYSQAATELAERVLLEVWSRLGEFRQHLVLVGGLVPRYLVRRRSVSQGMTPAHCGTMDVDLGISLAVAELRTYESIRSILVDTLGFAPGENLRGREQRHSFVKQIAEQNVVLDFLTVRYDGPEGTLLRAVEENLSAIQVEGLGLALRDPLRVPVKGTLLEDGEYEAAINVCRAAPFVVLKALALASRGERKDAYDLVYVLRYYGTGPGSVAAEVRDDEREQPSFVHAMNELKSLFGNERQSGPMKYQAFDPAVPNAAVQAYAAVREFLEALQR